MTAETRRIIFLIRTFGDHIDWVPVCPEVEIGMGIPRKAVRLVGDPVKPRMIAERSGKEWTLEFNAFAAKRAQALTGVDLAGYIFKKNSPSCGVERVRVYSSICAAPARPWALRRSRHESAAVAPGGRGRPVERPVSTGAFRRTRFCLSSLATTGTRA
jgi:hypothetical protein